VQTTGLPPTHAPLSHVSVFVQELPSLHAEPLAFAGFEHAPVAESHAPATWHWSEAVHTTGFDPTHAPLWHESLLVHALPSLHVEPFGFDGLEHVPFAGLHAPAT
jgi:hypothetical protein